MKDIIDNITKDLSQYNSTADKTINAVNKSMITIGFLIVSFLFLLELISWYKFIRNQGGEMTWKLFLEIGMKYLIAYFLVIESGAILDAILWFINGIAKSLGGSFTGDMFKFEAFKKGNWGIRIVLNALGYIFGAAAVLSTKVLVLLRFVELYILKAIAPIIVAFWMSETTRSIAVSVLKRFSAYALQGVVIILILIVWESFQIDTAITISESSWLGNFASGFAYLGKCIVFLILLFGSQRKAKELLQA